MTVTNAHLLANDLSTGGLYPKAWVRKMCIRDSYCSRCMLVTDDKHPGDLLDSGHIDSNIRKAIRLGADPAVAVKMATLVPAQYFGFKQHGAVAPGYAADLIVVSDFESFTVEQVYKNGTLVAERCV